VIREALREAIARPRELAGALATLLLGYAAILAGLFTLAGR
jgi:hypothetical protein